MLWISVNLFPTPISVLRLKINVIIQMVSFVVLNSDLGEPVGTIT